MQELKTISPEMYERLVAATTDVEVESCAGCEYCRAGVTIDITEETVAFLLTNACQRWPWIAY